jgi:hypothetical protein
MTLGVDKGIQKCNIMKLVAKMWITLDCLRMKSHGGIE